MNKRELIARVQRHMGIGSTRDAARAAVNAVLESILQTAAEGERVHLAHLGSFEYKEHQPRNGKGLPNTTPVPQSPEHRLSFRPATTLKNKAAHKHRP